MRHLVVLFVVVSALLSGSSSARAHGGHHGHCTDVPALAVKTGWFLASNRDAAIPPSAGIDLELCLGRYQYAHWAPSRAALEFLVSSSTDPASGSGILDWGGGLRLQFPVMEIADAGVYGRYSFGAPDESGVSSRHTLIAGGLFELRPFYSSHPDHNPFGGGLNFQIRSGYGTELGSDASSVERFEFMLYAGYRFAGF